MLWERCDDERDLVASGKGVYGGGEPRLELRGRTTGGEDGVKRKGWDRKGEGAAVVDDARLRVRVAKAKEEARLRKAGEAVADDGPGTGGNDELESGRLFEMVVKVKSARGGGV